MLILWLINLTLILTHLFFFEEKKEDGISMILKMQLLIKNREN